MLTEKARKILRIINQYVENSATLEAVSKALSDLKEEDVLSVNEQDATLYFCLLQIIVQIKKEKMLPVWDEFWKYHLLLDYPAIKHSLTKEGALNQNPIEYIVFSLHACTTPAQQNLLSILFEQHLWLVKYCSKLESTQEWEALNHNLMLRINNKLLFFAAPSSLLESYFKQLLPTIGANMALGNAEPLEHLLENLLFEPQRNIFTIYGQLLNRKAPLAQLMTFLNLLRTLRARDWITAEKHTSYLLGHYEPGYSILHTALMENNFKKIKASFEEIRCYCSKEQVKEALLYGNARLGRTVIQQAINNGNYKHGHNIACIETAQYFIEVVESSGIFTPEEAYGLLEGVQCTPSKLNGIAINQLIAQSLERLSQHQETTIAPASFF